MGLWSIPGGKLAAGESLRHAVVRELREETGIAVRVGPLVEVFERLPRLGDEPDTPHYVVLDYLCHPLGGALSAGDDAADAGWFDIGELANLSLTSGALDVIRKASSMASALRQTGPPAGIP